MVPVTMHGLATGCRRPKLASIHDSIGGCLIQPQTETFVVASLANHIEVSKGEWMRLVYLIRAVI